MVSWFWMPRRGDRFGGPYLPENRLAHGPYHSTATEMPINPQGLLLPRRLLIPMAGTLLLAATTAIPRLHARDAASELIGPDAVTSQLAVDEQDKPDLLGIDAQDKFDEWKAGIKEQTGLDFGIDYNSLGFAAIDSPGKSFAASGVFRVFGSWELYNRGEANNGSIVFKAENRLEHGFLRVQCETCYAEHLVAFSCTNSRRFRRAQRFLSQLRRTPHGRECCLAGG